MQFSQEDVNNNKVMGILAYLGFLSLIPFFAAKESPYAQFHAKQGLTLFVVEVIFSILAFVLAFIPIVGPIVSLLIGICILVLVVIGIMNALGTEAKKLPVLGMIKIF